MAAFQEIVARENHYLLPTYARYPLALQRGKGVYLWDFEGKKYLDLLSGLGVNALGHAHPRIVKVIRDQAAKLIHVSNLYYNEYQGQLAEKLCRDSGLQRAFFSNSGTEAIEGALKLVRHAGHDRGGDAKSKVVALDNSFHGRTLGALSLTGQPKYRKNFDPLPGAVQFVDRNNIEQLNSAVTDETCAIIIEPIQGEGGVCPSSVEFLRAARAAADRHHAALIFDEIQCGLGRTGRLFAFQHFGVRPDVVCLAKPIAAGLPLGAFLVTEELGAAFSPGKHGTTFGGGPLACRVALEFLAILEEENRLEQVKRVGEYFTEQLAGLVDKFDIAAEARGVGMMQALELNISAKGFVDAGIAEGVLFNVTQDNVLRFLPPFLLEEQHVDKGIRVVKKLLRNAQKQARETRKAEKAVAVG
ncbi:MAG TPA: aspartate aminotransferase family protein [Candidatus Koribacter sp.]|jgi:predicted acetylornithine/succinylornithine family transaminase